MVRARELAVADQDPLIGKILENRYTIVARIGSGSMGAVYRAKQNAMGREVAIKILRGDRAIDEAAKARFLREARANSLLASPNTVTVFDFGQNEVGDFYLAMELLEGESLGQRLTRLGKLSIPLAVDTARQALRSLAEAHAKGIIHRDLKPDNLFFARVLTSAAPTSPMDGHEEIVKVLDFGIAKMMRDDNDPMGVVETQAGTVFGTPRYMSPEQAQGKPLDARTDLYSLGVILYQMLTGRPPFTDNDAVVVMARHIKSVPKRPNEAVPEANVPKELEDVVMRALSKEAADRQPSADHFSNELLAALEALGAMTSGVRSSVEDAARVRLPDSMRPPPPAAPQKSRSSGWMVVVTILLPLVVLAAGAGVFYRQHLKRLAAAARAHETPPAATAETPSAAPSTSIPSAEPRAVVSVPTESHSVGDLPAIGKPPPTSGQRSPHGKPIGRPATKAPPSPATNGTTPSPPRTASPASSYDVFN